MRKFPNSFSDLLEVSARPLKKGDRLLLTSTDWYTSAKFAPDRVLREVCIWDGYMEAGAALVDETERQPLMRNVLLFPILFNYRHGLEVAMKWVVEHFGSTVNVTLDARNHDLWELWQKCRCILDTTGTYDEPLTALEQLVKEFHELDKGSLSFRYSDNKNGEIIPLPDEAIDLQNIQDVMGGVNNFFKGAIGILSDRLL
jgi:hypothetical protein